MQHLLILIQIMSELIHCKLGLLSIPHLLSQHELHVKHLLWLVLVWRVGHLPLRLRIGVLLLLPRGLRVESTALFIHIFN